ncbi:hypothetical protein [Kitasatospora xanthocidica]|uniref:hypothetical protein n=1 Tax=Kitasatospora xanthocidica TaxID=83382 RepID=UPI0011C4309C|nr:hypothetical protein [Kitasatospora xanthocidica]
MIEHVYKGWAVTLANGNVVNFTDQKQALIYFGDHDTTEMKMKQQAIECGMFTRGFCGHCSQGVPTRMVTR